MGGYVTKIDVAGLCVELHCLYPNTQALCAGYGTERAPDYVFENTQEDLDRERNFLQDDRASDGYLETLVCHRKIADAFLDRDILLFHGSALEVEGRGILFTAPSGTGKSTHARLWREQFGAEVTMINDDKPLLRFTENGVLVCGTPWNGKHHLGSNRQVPLAAIVHLVRGEENRIRPVSSGEMMPTLLRQSYRRLDAPKMQKLLTLAAGLGKYVDFYELTCNMEPEAPLVCREGLRSSFQKVGEHYGI